MVKLVAVVVALLAVLGAAGFYATSGTAGTEANRSSQLSDPAAKEDDASIVSNGLLLVGVGMIAAGMVGKRKIAGK
ncbi:MAG: hypothetical protein FJ145_14235 [Deltaproteobacteria bacterium]|nr:hypothetical protein [Deltaproteobacteria bacterium]